MSNTAMLVRTLQLALLIVCLAPGAIAAPLNGGDESYWLERKYQFYKDTTFTLSDANIRLFGGKYSPVHTGHLPFWFDFELYKTAFGKRYENENENLARHNAYIKHCVRVLKARVLFRILAGSEDTIIDDDSDRLPYVGSSGDDGSLVNQSGEIAFVVPFDLDEMFTRQGESPLERGIRLVREELDRVESRNQLDNYLQAFDELDGSAIAKLPYSTAGH